MNTLGERIKSLRKFHNLSQDELVNCLNNTFHTSIVHSMLSKWENNKEYPRMDFISDISNYFSVSIDYLICNSNYKNALEELYSPDLLSSLQSIGCLPDSDLIKLPILGDIKAGYNYCVHETLLGYEYVEKSFLASKSSCFFLRITGDSMKPMFQENNLVLIEPTTSVESGTISAALINNEDATLKIVLFQDSSLILQPFNSLYPPRIFMNDDINTVKIIGKVIQSIRNF